MTRREVTKSFIVMLLSAMAALFALLCAIDVFGWFSMSRHVVGNGMNIYTKSDDMLKITKGDGTEISATSKEELANKDQLSVPVIGSTDSKIHPGVSGSFTFFVEEQTPTSTPYSFHYRISVQNDWLSTNEGFSENTEKYHEDALNYIQSHLLCFTTYENKRYSGWIQPDAMMPFIPLPNAEGVQQSDPYEVTVYWVWVAQYEQIFTENGILIEENTRQKIATYYSGDNLKKILAETGRTPSERYDLADSVIGMTLKKICFLIEVKKD